MALPEPTTSTRTAGAGLAGGREEQAPSRHAANNRSRVLIANRPLELSGRRLLVGERISEVVAGGGEPCLGLEDVVQQRRVLAILVPEVLEVGLGGLLGKPGSLEARRGVLHRAPALPHIHRDLVLSLLPSLPRLVRGHLLLVGLVTPPPPVPRLPAQPQTHRQDLLWEHLVVEVLG